MSESKHIASLNHDRIFGFDILRACAIIFVVAVHGRFLVEGTFLYDFPYLIFADGVDLFFVLSGFLIGTILLKEISTSKSFTFSQLTNFWKRRWFRTLPNYYLILLVNVIIVKYNIINEDINQFLDYLSTISSEQEIIVGEESHLKAQQIEKAINKLSNRGAEAINLRFYQGLSLDETSKIMQTPKQVVKNLLSKSIAILRVSLKKVVSLTAFVSLLQ